VARRALGAGLAALLAAAGLFVGASPAGARQLNPKVGVEMPATAMNRSATPSNNSPALVADPRDARFVVLANRLDAPDFGCALQVSGDGGRGWVPANPVPELPKGAEKCYGAEAAFDRAGRLYYLFVGLHGLGNEPMGAFLTTSTDRGRTFSAPRQVLGPFNFAVRMAIDPGLGSAGRIHLAWLHATSDPPLGGFGPAPNPIMAAHSDDGGASFSEPIQVSDPDRSRVVAPVLALGPDHRVYVGYYDLQTDERDYKGLEGPTWDGTWSLVVSVSSDGGRRFSGGVVVDDSIGPAERVMLIFTMPPASLVAGPGKRVCAAWTDARGTDADALLRCSTDRGVTWGPLRRLNDDPKEGRRRQYLPRLSVAPGGRLDAIFFDRRDSPPNLPDLGNDVYYTFSTDDGRSFAPNIRLTSATSVSVIGQQYANVAANNLYEFGLRLGLLSLRTGVIAAWPDTRNSLPDSTAQDIFTVEVDMPTSPGRGSTQLAWAATGVGGVGVAAGLVTVRVRRRRRRYEADPEPVADPVAEPAQSPT